MRLRRENAQLRFDNEFLGKAAAYFASQNAVPTPRQERMGRLVKAVTALYAASDGTYGARRIREDLVAEGWRVGVKTLAEALRQAVALRGVLPGKVIFRADRGCQYTSAQIAELAAGLDLLQSVGGTGVCWDNAQAASFWSTFKNEYYYRHVFTTLDQLRRATYVWIDSWYNARRRHSALSYLSPLEYERRLVTEADR